MSFDEIIDPTAEEYLSNEANTFSKKLVNLPERYHEKPTHPATGKELA